MWTLSSLMENYSCHLGSYIWAYRRYMIHYIGGYITITEPINPLLGVVPTRLISQQNPWLITMYMSNAATLIEKVCLHSALCHKCNCWVDIIWVNVLKYASEATYWGYETDKVHGANAQQAASTDPGVHWVPRWHYHVALPNTTW